MLNIFFVVWAYFWLVFMIRVQLMYWQRNKMLGKIVNLSEKYQNEGKNWTIVFDNYYKTSYNQMIWSFTWQWDVDDHGNVIKVW